MPFRIEEDGSARIMLITSRGSGRWIIPKGNPMRGMKAHVAAAHEAYEEAGLSGHSFATAIGRFHYRKRLKTGETRAIEVEVFPLAVAAQAADWPEKHERQTHWFTVADAASAVSEPDLSGIIRRFRPPPASARAEGGWFRRAVRLFGRQPPTPGG
ncbi:NUDIX hydrolase [Sphingomonas profundi]|uniref:NUDIX hydrolase n=1 Tax=Alterirhizorhabdus profundi TaxID=2681549 RepID=UPI0018D100F9|nr:NUDIX hydrolase [Sphingomonas profundi]